ncbi:hypothetical protein CN980_13245 [Bacillus cereus]|uniref:Uncharacterized protein n=1 Tax=Bacillus cereus TaxID=1396 RepID=A0A9X7GQ54_BACCE|nr:hypothetical protein CN980_13245 [Bacillus cereus]
MHFFAPEPKLCNRTVMLNQELGQCIDEYIKNRMILKNGKQLYFDSKFEKEWISFGSTKENRRTCTGSRYKK